MATSKTWTQTLDLDPGPGPRKTWTLKTLLVKNMGNSWMQKKKIGRPQSVIYYNTKILQEETCKEAISKKNYLVFLGIQKMCLRLRAKVNSEAIKK